MPGAINNVHLPISQSTLGHAPFATFEFPSSRDNGVQSPSTASTNGSFSTMQAGFLNSTVPSTNARDEEGEEGGKKKKVRIVHILSYWVLPDLIIGAFSILLFIHYTEPSRLSFPC